jgi:ribosome modulation factor
MEDAVRKRRSDEIKRSEKEGWIEGISGKKKEHSM